MVFLVNDMASFSPQQENKNSERLLKKLKQGLEALALELSSKDLKLVILHGLPFAREAKCDPETAIPQWFNPFGSQSCPMPNRKQSLDRRKKLDEVLLPLQKEKGVTIVDLFDIFCPTEICSYVSIDGQILYRDEHSHPSIEAARLSASKIRIHLLETRNPYQ
jgi:hypothetical protein